MGTFWKIGFAGVIRGLETGSFWLLWVALSPMTSVLMRNSRRHVTTEAETRVTRPQAWGAGAPGTGRGRPGALGRARPVTSPRAWSSAPERVVPLFRPPVCSPGDPSVQSDREQIPSTAETPAGHGLRSLSRKTGAGRAAVPAGDAEVPPRRQAGFRAGSWSRKRTLAPDPATWERGPRWPVGGEHVGEGFR